jgi:hypothetical protein
MHYDFFMPIVVETPAISLRLMAAPGLAAVRKFWRPFLLLQAAALGLVVAYYGNAQVRTVCGHLSDFKQQAGLIFSAIATALAGALMPELAKALVMGDRKLTRQRVADVCFALVIFGINGVMVDLQYRAFGVVLGQDNHPLTIVEKVLADQFVTTPLYSMPYWVFVFALRANGFDLIRTVRDISLRWYLVRGMPILIPAWCYWLPMTSMIYALPGPLQFCLFCFAVAAWSLLMVFVATQETQTQVGIDPIP